MFRRMALAAIVALVVASMPPPSATGAVPPAARHVTIDFSTVGTGYLADPLAFKADGLVLPSQRCFGGYCEPWFVGVLLGDEALVGNVWFTPISGRFTGPVFSLSVRVAPAAQATVEYTLTAFDQAGKVVGATSLTQIMDTGDPDTGPFAFVTVDLGVLARPARSFSVDMTWIRSSFNTNPLTEYGLSSISYDQLGPSH